MMADCLFWQLAIGYCIRIGGNEAILGNILRDKKFTQILRPLADKIVEPLSPCYNFISQFAYGKMIGPIN